jgi:hypothetical protein
MTTALIIIFATFTFSLSAAVLAASLIKALAYLEETR